MPRIDASMLENIFAAAAPFSRVAKDEFALGVDNVTIKIVASQLVAGVMGSANIGAGSVGPAAINFDSGDVPHSSPSVAATDVEGALEEVALGYLACLPLAGGTMAGVIDMGGLQITNLGAPTASTDAATAGYVDTKVQEGTYYRIPVQFGGTAVPKGGLRPTWIRATAGVYFSANPLPGDTFVLNGVSFTFNLAPGPNMILIGPTPNATAANMTAELNANATIDLDGDPLNSDFYAIQDAGVGWAIQLVCLNEDPPNFPEDGNLKPMTMTSTALSLVPFHGGLGTLLDGMVVSDVYTNGIWTWNAQEVGGPAWKDITGTGGTITANNVWYNGPLIPAIAPTPDNLENILIALNTTLTAGLPPSPHAFSHQAGGMDEVDVGGLSGLLADPQTPDIHAANHQAGGPDQIDLAGMFGLLATAQNPTLHAINHESGGVDELDLTNMTGLLVTPQTPILHAATHQNGQPDEIDVSGLSGTLADAQNANKIQARSVAAAAPANGNVLAWNAGANQWEPQVSASGADFCTLIGLTDVVGISVGDIVYISAANTARRANASLSGRMPVRGMVSNTGVGTVDVRTSGFITGLAGLTPGATYYADITDGNISTVAPVALGHWVQQIGWALSATTFVVDLKEAGQITP